MTVSTGNEVQSVTITGSPGGGTYTLSLGAGTSAGIAPGANAAALKSALEGVSTIGVGNVDVTGADGGPYTVTFKGALRDTNVAQLVADSSGLTGGTSPAAAVATVAQGDPPVDAIAYADVSTGGSVRSIELLVGQTPPPGALLVTK